MVGFPAPHPEDSTLARDRSSRLLLTTAAVALAACAHTPPAPPPAGAPPPSRTPLVIAHDPGLAVAAAAFEHRYELDRPNIDVRVAPNADTPRADVRLLDEPAEPAPAESLLIERRVAVVVPADSALRLIDLSRGTCDVIIGEAGTPLGELGRATLHARGLDDQINQRLLEAEADDILDWMLERDAVALAFATHAADRAAEVRVVAEGERDTAMIVAASPEGARFLDWLAGGFTTRRPLRTQGFDLAGAPLPVSPQDTP